MTIPEVKKGPTRSGTAALELLSAPLNLQLLRGLQRGPMSVIDLQRDIGSPPQSTMRIYLRALEDVRAVSRAHRPGFQISSDYALAAPGLALMTVAASLQRWLSFSPQGGIELGTPVARSAIRALLEGLSSSMVRALAGQTLSLTELARLIPRISYPALERRLTVMRLVGLVEAHRGEGRATPYQPTDWLRRAVAPLTSAAEWEREYIPETTSPIGRLDVEAVFLLAAPLMELPATLTGKVRLAVEIQRGVSPVFAGVLVSVEGGEVTSCTAGLDGEAEAWISGAPRSWLRRMNLGEGDHLELGGDSGVARAVLDGLARTTWKP
jgi:DNA-binding HxlR family transcriptional regulator